MYMTTQPGVSTFVAEFLKRKDAELARGNAKNRKKKVAAEAGPPSMAAVAGGAKKAPVPSAATRGQAIVYPAPAAALGTSPAGGSSWQQIPTVAKPVVKKAPAKGGAKNQPKASGVYSVLGAE